MWVKRRGEPRLQFELRWAVLWQAARRWRGHGERLSRVFTYRRSLQHRCCRCPGRWLRCSRHPGGGRWRCPGGLWGCWRSRHPGSGRHRRENHPPQRGAGAWTTWTGSRVGPAPCLRRRSCPLWRKTQSKRGPRCGCCAANGTRPASIRWVLMAGQLPLGSDACRSHWSGKQKQTLWHKRIF